MSHFKSNLRDQEFNLFEVFRIQDRLGRPPFDGVDLDTVRQVLRELDVVARGPVAESYIESDRNQAIFDPQTRSVLLPEALRRSFQTLMDGQWWRLSLPAELGGYGVPPTVQWAAAELLLGANAAVFMYLSGPNTAIVVHKEGTEQQQRWAELIIERGWASTMVLTEADAGSDVGVGRTKAVQQPDGSWHIDGVKRFITSGDHDLTENIMHLVLARPEGPGVQPKPGTKGLSLFLVPKYLFDAETGEIGGRNGAYVTGVERKMGLKLSVTCELTFGQHDRPAVGYLLGDRHDGIAQMFKVIEYARMLVGTKAIGTLSTGYLNALDYAKHRVQGADLPQMLDKTAPRVTIIHHPDVRRMLMLQKCYAEGLRGIYCYAATFQDEVKAAEATGQDASLAARVNDLLLPIVKGVGSERAYEMLSLSLQTLGGSGYLQDYPIEQYIRDAKIDSLYEGTTAIQSLDFFFRKIVRDRRVALDHVLGEIQVFLDAEAGNGRLKQERAGLVTALADVQAMVDAMIGDFAASVQDPTSIYKVGQHTVRLLMSVGDLLIGWLLLRQGEIAQAALDTGVGLKSVERAFYEGKLGAARFFARTVLPELSARRVIVENADNTVMEVEEASF